MKRILKGILYTAAAIVILMVIISVGYLIKFKYETGKMTPLETKQVADNIYALQDSFVNLFLIKDSTQYIAIDAGNNSETISTELQRLRISPDKIVAVLLTHTHGDHVTAIKLFKNAKIYFSKEEEQMINGETSVFLGVGNSIDTKVYSLIEDNQVFTIGNIKIKGILTPGHTPGSMSYLMNDTYLFTGDALSIKSGNIAEFNDFFNMDTKTANRSIEKIIKTSGVEYIFSSHYGYYKNAAQDIEVN